MVNLKVLQAPSSLPVAGPRAPRGPAADPSEFLPSPARDVVTLGAGPSQRQEPAAPALAASGQAAAGSAAGAVLGGLVGAVTGLVVRPVKAVVSTLGFALGFLGDMRTRAEEITQDPARVEQHLKAEGVHHEYTAPEHHTNAKVEGVMTIRADMSEFFTLWDSWITKGYGSINDRQYADLARKYRDLAPGAPLLKYIPMVSEDVFSLEVRDGKVTFMDETTTSRFAGLVPMTKVEWAYERDGLPRAANSFEATIDRFDGDLDKVQAFYNDLFDPKKVLPDSKATVDFQIREVDTLPERTPPAREFTHSVQVPLGRLLPRPATTM